LNWLFYFCTSYNGLGHGTNEGPCPALPHYHVTCCVNAGGLCAASNCITFCLLYQPAANTQCGTAVGQTQFVLRRPQPMSQLQLCHITLNARQCNNKTAHHNKMAPHNKMAYHNKTAHHKMAPHKMAHHNKTTHHNKMAHHKKMAPHNKMAHHKKTAPHNKTAHHNKMAHHNKTAPHNKTQGEQLMMCHCVTG
jgi:hypothetical protein